MTDSFLLRVADVTVEVFPQTELLASYCARYIIKNGTPEFTVRITEEDAERDESELLALHRKLAEKLCDYNVLLFHGSALSVDGDGFLFTGPSGTGKSTHAKLWRKAFGDRVVMINDDKPFLRITDDQVLVYGSPWAGKHRLETDTVSPVKGIAVLHQAPENRMKRIGGIDAYIELLKQTYHSNEKDRAEKALALLEELTKRVPIYSMDCNMDLSAAELSYRTMKEGLDEKL